MSDTWEGFRGAGVILSICAAALALASPREPVEPILQIDSYHGHFGGLVDRLAVAHGLKLRIPERWRDEVVFVHAPNKPISEFLAVFTKVTGARWAHSGDTYTLLASETPAAWHHPERDPLRIKRIQARIDGNIEQYEIESGKPTPDQTSLSIWRPWTLAKEIGAANIATIRPGETALFLVDERGQARKLTDLRDFKGEGKLLAAANDSFSEARLEAGKLVVANGFDPGRSTFVDPGEEISRKESVRVRDDRVFRFTYRTDAILKHFDRTVVGSPDADLLLTLHSAEVVKSMANLDKAAFAWLSPSQPLSILGLGGTESFWQRADWASQYWRFDKGWVICRPDYTSDQWQQLASPRAVRKLFDPGKELPLRIYLETLADLPTPVLERTAHILHPDYNSLWHPRLDIRPIQMFATLSHQERELLLRETTISISLDQHPARRTLLEHWLRHTPFTQNPSPLAQSEIHAQRYDGSWDPELYSKLLPDGVPPGATLAITWRPRTYTYVQEGNTIRGILFAHPSLQEFARRIAAYRENPSLPDPLESGVLT